MAETIRINGTVDLSIQKEIKKIAKSEKRSFSAMMSILLEEALLSRKVNRNI